MVSPQLVTIRFQAISEASSFTDAGFLTHELQHRAPSSVLLLGKEDVIPENSDQGMK
jgi:hypothetical protein